MRTEEEIREQLSKLRKKKRTQGPYIEKDNIVWHATKQALEWVLEERNPAGLLIEDFDRLVN